MPRPSLPKKWPGRLQQAEKGHFMIFPGTDSRLFYLLTSKLPKSLVFSILDKMAASGKKARKT